MSSEAQEPKLTITREAGGEERVELMLEGRSVSRLWIIPFTLHIGAAAVRMDGIGGVGTDKEFRHRGYARRVLEAAVEHMRRGDAALSMLYGIPDMYPKFGYATAGPDHFVSLTGLERPAAMPAGWRARPMAPADLPAVQELYAAATADAVGAAVRAPEGKVWAKLAANAASGGSECRVIEGPAGTVAAYAWRASDTWYAQQIQRTDPRAFVIGEAIAGGPVAAEAVLAACRLWAHEESAVRAEAVTRVVLSLPPEGPVAAAARLQDAEFGQQWSHCGGSMARVLSTGRLLLALAPELTRRAARGEPLLETGSFLSILCRDVNLAARMREIGEPFAGFVRIRTDLGDAVLRIAPEGVSVADARDTPKLTIELPQQELARLALGTFPPEDIWARLPDPPADSKGRRLLADMFPLRHPHMYLPDRF